MKTSKSALAIMCACCLASAGAMAQGTINFGNSSSSLVTTNVNGHSGSANVTSVSGIYVQLFYQPDTGGQAPSDLNVFSVLLAGYGGNSLGSWEAVGSPVIINPQAGRFSAGSLTTGADVLPQGNVWLEAVAWDGGYNTVAGFQNQAGPGYSQIGGNSTVWSQGTGGGGNLAVFTTGFTGLTLFTLSPEPSTWALMGLGAASLFAFRRRK